MQLRAPQQPTLRSVGKARRPQAPVCSAAAKGKAAAPAKPQINVIPDNGVWADGIPPVMGAHLMASNVVSPVSTSKGPGINVAVHQFQYPTKDLDAEVLIYENQQQSAQGLAEAVVKAAEEAIKAKGSFTLCLSHVTQLAQLAAIPQQKGVDFSKWWVFYADEVNVPLNSKDSVHKSVVDAFLSKTSIPSQQVFTIVEGLPTKQTATNYEGRLVALPTSVLPRTADHFPIFDLFILGVCHADGHVAALFPNKSQTSDKTSWVLPLEDSPLPPVNRITMTLPAINNAKDIILLAVGAHKAEIVHRTLEVQSLPGALPAQLVRPNNGRLRWVVDKEAASLLTIPTWADASKYPRSK